MENLKVALVHDWLTGRRGGERVLEALAELFKNPDVVMILKMREIYRHLSNAADRGDEAADILSDILVKNT